MDIKELKMLVAVVEAGSMSSAAHRLHTSRSNISRQLKKLESDFRVQIFRRTTRQLEPTQIGWAMYEHAVKVTQELTALEATVQDMGRSLRGHLRVSVPIGLGQLALGEALLEFCELHPDVTIQITFNNRVFDLLGEEVDISIRIANSPPGSYVARELADVEWVACVSSHYIKQRGNPATPEELVGHHLVTPPVRNNRLILGFLSGQQRHVIELMPKLQCADMIFLKRSVIMGSGIGVLPYYLIGEELKDGTLIRSLPDYHPDPKIWGDKIFLITAPSLYPSQMVRTLMDFLKKSFSDEGPIGALMKGQFGGAR